MGRGEMEGLHFVSAGIEQNSLSIFGQKLTKKKIASSWCWKEGNITEVMGYEA